MKKGTVFSKVAMGVLLIVVCISMMASFIFSQWINKQIHQRIIEESYVVIQSIEHAIKSMKTIEHSEEIQRLIDNMGSSEMIETLRIYNRDNLIIFSNKHDDIQTIDESVDLLAFQDLIDDTSVILSPLPKSQDNSVENEMVHWVIYLKISPDYERWHSHVFQKGFGVFVFGLGTAIVIFLFIFIHHSIARPLKYFSVASEEIAIGNYNYRIVESVNNEFMQLKNAFNHMAEEVERDTSDLQNSRKEAEEFVHKKMQFFANMSHEIRTPLNSIVGFSELLQENEVKKDKLKLLDIIIKSGNHLMDIVNDIMDISKLELSEFALENQSFSLPELLLDINRNYQPHAEHKHIRFIVKFEQSRPLNLFGDVYRIKQILNNLLSNAIKFTSKGFVELVVSYDQPMLQIKVSDSGIGIPLEMQKKVFDVFSQSDMSTTRVYGGTGLGLAICEKLVENMQGTIELVSEVNKGTQFTVELMLTEDLSVDTSEYEDLVIKWQMKDIETADLLELVLADIPEQVDQMKHFIEAHDISALKEAVHRLKGLTGNFKMEEFYVIFVEFDQYLMTAEKTDQMMNRFFGEIENVVSSIPMKYFNFSVTQKSESELEDTTINILLAEDIKENRLLVENILSGYGINITEAVNGEEALKLLKKQSFDALLLDMNMPIMDGVEVLKRIRSLPEYNNLWVVAMTASVLDEQVNAYYNWGCNSIISKPLNKELLRKELLALKTRILNRQIEALGR